MSIHPSILPSVVPLFRPSFHPPPWPSEPQVCSLRPDFGPLSPQISPFWPQFSPWHLKSALQSSNLPSTSGCLEIHPCVLQDISPFGPLPCSYSTILLDHSKQGIGYRWQCAILGWLVTSNDITTLHPLSIFLLPLLSPFLLSLYLHFCPSHAWHVIAFQMPILFLWFSPTLPWYFFLDFFLSFSSFTFLLFNFPSYLPFCSPHGISFLTFKRAPPKILFFFFYFFFLPCFLFFFSVRML